MSVESVTQSVSNLALSFGDDDADAGAMVSSNLLPTFAALNKMCSSFLWQHLDQKIVLDLCVGTQSKLEFSSAEYKLVKWKVHFVGNLWNGKCSLLERFPLTEPREISENKSRSFCANFRVDRLAWHCCLLVRTTKGPNCKSFIRQIQDGLHKAESQSVPSPTQGEGSGLCESTCCYRAVHVVTAGLFSPSLQNLLAHGKPLSLSLITVCSCFQFILPDSTLTLRVLTTSTKLRR